MSSVIIQDVLPYTQTVAVGSQTVFSTNWTADAAADVFVYQRANNVAPDDATQILSPSDYTVAFIGLSQIVQVTLINPASNGDIITIVRVTPVDRENLYTNTNFVPSMLNEDFGLVTMQIQESDASDQIRTPRYPNSAIINTWDLILPILGPGESWVMNDAGDQILAEVAGGGSPSDLAFNTFIVQTPSLTIPNAQALSLLSTGILKSTTTTGILSISAPLTSIDGLTTAADKMIYTTAPNVYTTTDLTAFARSLLDDANAAAAATTLQVLPLAGGTMAGAINMGANFITNLLDPVNPQDAATKNYTDNALASGFLPLSGGTMSGQIDMGNNKIVNLADPTLNQDAVTLISLNTQLTNYLQKAGGTMTGAINMNSHFITNLLDPVNPQDAATKGYVDLVATGLTVQPACYAATTANLTATYANGASGIGATLTNSGALAQFQTDGTTPPTNARILVWNQSSTLQNGIYTLTNQGSGAVAWVLTRASDYDQPAEIQPGDLVIIQNGTLYATSSFIQSDSVAAVGTDPIQFTQFTFAPTSFLLKASNLSDVANKTTSFNNISPLTTKGDLLGFNSTDNIRLGVGSNSSILMADSTATVGFKWTTATYPNTTTVSQILYSSASNTISGLATTNGGVLVTDNTGVPSMLTNPGAANRMLQSANAAIPAWSTTTWPATSTINQLLYSSAANTVVGLATVNGGMLGTNSTGVPTFLANPSAANRVLFSVSGDLSAWSAYALPSAVGTTGNALISDGTNFVSAPVSGTSPLTTKGDLFGFSTVNARIPVGANGTLLQADSAQTLGLKYTTATYPTTTTINQILWSNANNTVVGLATVNSGVLVTDGSGVPSISTTLPSGIAATNMALTTPALGTPSSGDLSNCTGTPLAKAWGHFHWTGAAIVVDKAFNVSSVTRSATGSYTVNFTSSMADANYAVVTGQNSGSGTSAINATTLAAGSFKIFTFSGGSLADATAVFFAVYD